MKHNTSWCQKSSLHVDYTEVVLFFVIITVDYYFHCNVTVINNKCNSQC